MELEEGGEVHWREGGGAAQESEGGCFIDDPLFDGEPTKLFHEGTGAC